MPMYYLILAFAILIFSFSIVMLGLSVRNRRIVCNNGYLTFDEGLSTSNRFYFRPAELEKTTIEYISANEIYLTHEGNKTTLFVFNRMNSRFSDYVRSYKKDFKS